MNIVKNVVVVLLLGLISCGPSNKEQAAEEKRKNDSIVTATKEQIFLEQAKNDSIKAESQKRAKRDKEVKDSIENLFIELKAELEMQETKLRNIREFHLGRTYNEKETQVYEQTKVIEALKLQVSELQEKLQ